MLSFHVLLSMSKVSCRFIGFSNINLIQSSDGIKPTPPTTFSDEVCLIGAWFSGKMLLRHCISPTSRSTSILQQIRFSGDDVQQAEMGRDWLSLLLGLVSPDNYDNPSVNSFCSLLRRDLLSTYFLFYGEIKTSILLFFEEIIFTNFLHSGEIAFIIFLCLGENQSTNILFIENAFKRSGLTVLRAKSSFVRSSSTTEELALSKELSVVIYEYNLLSLHYLALSLILVVTSNSLALSSLLIFVIAV